MTLVRFAPSPTGLIHIGNARTAIVNYLFARKNAGQFLLRFDDTDVERSNPEFAAAIAEDLEWLGIHPDQIEQQSARTARYAEAAARLKADGRLYPCYETPDELDRRRKRQLARGLPPVYDRAALKLTPEERAQFEADGRKPHWRFKLDHKPVDWAQLIKLAELGSAPVIAEHRSRYLRRLAQLELGPGIVWWDDLVRGPQHIDTKSLSDPVLVRGDGSYLYTFTSVVDDIDLGVSHVIRGEDHVVNTAVQIEIFEALHGRVPHFAHHSLLIGADGKGLSKRLGSLSIRSLREQGLEAMAVVSHTALLGTSESIHPCADYQELIAGFDLSKLSRAPARFDEAELRHLNAKLLHMLPYAAVKDRLGFGNEAFWLAVRGNLALLSDARLWWDVVTSDIAPAIAADDRDFIAAAAGLLPGEPWGDKTWADWTAAIKAATERKGKGLFMPLRLALTGLDHGPELAALLPLIGREKSLKRLAAIAD